MSILYSIHYEQKEAFCNKFNLKSEFVKLTTLELSESSSSENSSLVLNSEFENFPWERLRLDLDIEEEISVLLNQISPNYRHYPYTSDMKGVFFIAIWSVAIECFKFASPEYTKKINNIHQSNSLISWYITTLFSILRSSIRIENGQIVHPPIAPANIIISQAVPRFIQNTAFGKESNQSLLLFDALNTLSTMYYEKKSINGYLLLCNSGDQHIEYKVKFQLPLPFLQLTRVRKLLVPTIQNNQHDECLYLISDGHFIYGFGYINSFDDINDQSIFLVCFYGQNKWSFCNTDTTNVIFKNEFGRITIQEVDPLASISDLYSNQFQRDYDMNLNIIIQQCIQNGYGTTLVVLDDAESESERLKKDGIKCEPFDIDYSVNVNVSKIDGATLIGLDGKCYGIGYILDGFAVEEADSSRGSRYNSAYRYYKLLESKNIKSLIFVISDDGMINTVPKYPLSTPKPTADEPVLPPPSR